VVKDVKEILKKKPATKESAPVSQEPTKPTGKLPSVYQDWTDLMKRAKEDSESFADM
jgi:hypothetical protein